MHEIPLTTRCKFSTIALRFTWFVLSVFFSTGRAHCLLASIEQRSRKTLQSASASQRKKRVCGYIQRRSLHPRGDNFENLHHSGCAGEWNLIKLKYRHCFARSPPGKLLASIKQIKKKASARTYTQCGDRIILCGQVWYDRETGAVFVSSASVGDAALWLFRTQCGSVCCWL